MLAQHFLIHKGAAGYVSKGAAVQRYLPHVVLGVGNCLLFQSLPLVGRQRVKVSVDMDAFRLAGGFLLFLPAMAVGSLCIDPAMLLIGSLLLAKTIGAQHVSGRGAIVFLDGGTEPAGRLLGLLAGVDEEIEVVDFLL